MFGIVEQDMFFYRNLETDEEKNLKSIESDLGKILLENNVYNRAIWEKRDNLIRFIIPRDSKENIEIVIPEDEFVDFSSNDIISYIRNNLES